MSFLGQRKRDLQVLDVVSQSLGDRYGGVGAVFGNRMTNSSPA